MVKPVYFTVILNGVLLHNHQASLGPMSTGSSRITPACHRVAADAAGSQHAGALPEYLDPEDRRVRSSRKVKVLARGAIGSKF